MPHPRLFLLLLPALLLLAALQLHLNAAHWKARLSSPTLSPTVVTGLSHVLATQTPSPTPPPSHPPSHPPPEYERVAVCITGHLRTLLHPPVYESIHRHLLGPLSPYPTTLFLHLGLHDVPRDASASPAAALPTPAALAALRSHFPSARVSFFNNTRTGIAAGACPRATRRVARAVPAALQRARECLRLVERREAATGAAFGWVYKTRPDVAFGAPVAAPRALRRDTAYVDAHNPGTSAHAHAFLRRRFGKDAARRLHAPVGDHVLAAARGVAGAVLRADEALAECALWEMPDGAVNSEVALTYWLVRMRVRYEVTRWLWMLVRPGGRVECARARWIGGDATSRCEEFARTGGLEARAG